MSRLPSVLAINFYSPGMNLRCQQYKKYSLETPFYRTRRNFRGFKISCSNCLTVILASFRILLLRNCWFFLLQNGSLVFPTRVNLTRRLKILQQSHDSPPGRSSCKLQDGTEHVRSREQQVKISWVLVAHENKWKLIHHGNYDAYGITKVTWVRWRTDEGTILGCKVFAAGNESLMRVSPAVFILGFWNWEGILVFLGSRCIDFLHNDA